MIKSKIANEVAEEKIISKIFLVRGKKVMLDRDLAGLYMVSTGALNQAVKRNSKRFPEDFMFQLTMEELENWKSQNVITNKEKMGIRKLPMVFTEQGVAMLSSVLKSETAILVNIQIVRIFTRFREMLVSHKDILLKLEQLERKVMNHDEELVKVFTVLKQLLTPANPPRERIGFKRRNEK